QSSFRGDNTAHMDTTVKNLLLAPITHVQNLIKGAGPDELNAAGAAFCGQFRKLVAKYPFSGNPASTQATVADVNAIFRKPDGELWKFYEGSLQKILPKQGAKYVAAPAPGINPS